MKITYADISKFGEHVEYVVQVPKIVDGNVLADVAIKRIPIDTFLEGENLTQTLESVEKDYEMVTTLRPIGNITEQEKHGLADKYHSDVVDYATQPASLIAVVRKLKEVVSYPDWQTGIEVKAGEVYKFESNLYEVIQSHTTQSDWTPPIAKSLWKRFYEPSDDPWPWVQPTGAHDAYPLGARVEYNGNIYESTIDANVWAPDVTGWKNLTAPETSEWTAGTAYKVGDEVTYKSKNYRCLQAHAAQVGWEPSNVPALWERI
jgi:hypothetical protein